MPIVPCLENAAQSPEMAMPTLDLQGRVSDMERTLKSQLSKVKSSSAPTLDSAVRANHYKDSKAGDVALAPGERC